MAQRSRGRGTAAAFGFLLLIAGLLGAGVLYVLSTQRPDKAVDGFARASAGCTTTLDFTETGTFFVYTETGSRADTADEGCAPTPTLGERFSFEITGPADVTPVADVTVTYDRGDVTGASVARFEIATAGLYEIAVRSEDVATVAAVGRDPDSGVEQQQRNALIVGVTGGLLGLLLLALAGWRSKKATAPVTPEGPGWGTRAADAPADWPPAAPEVARRAINPQQPDLPVEAAPPPPPLPARAPGAGVPLSPWGAPNAAQPVSSEAPMPPPPVRTPQPIPVLPDSAAAVSGQWPPTPPPPPPPPPK